MTKIKHNKTYENNIVIPKKIFKHKIERLERTDDLITRTNFLGDNNFKPKARSHQINKKVLYIFYPSTSLEHCFSSHGYCV